MRSPLVLIAVVLAIVALAAAPLDASSIVPMDLEQVSRQAAWILEGTVVDLETVTTGTPLPQDDREVMPAPPVDSDPGSPPAETQAPIPLAVEGGQMIHTRVTLRVTREIAGEAGESITFTVAGGILGEERTVVLGMPTFELGRRYVVFLRPDFASTGVPLVGVSQGFFRLEEREPGRQASILDFHDDVVVGVEAGQVIVQQDRERRQQPLPELGPVPTPAPGSDARAGRDPQVDRYRRAAEPPLPPEQFYAAIQRLRQVR